MKKKLYRSRKNKIVGGVCGGLGEYFEIDPVLIRVLFVFLTFFHGSGLLLYLLLLIIVPYEPLEFSEPDETISDKNTNLPENEIKEVNSPKKNTKKVLGIILLVLGILLLLNNLLPIFDFNITFPLILVLAGIYLIFESIRNLGS